MYELVSFEQALKAARSTKQLNEVLKQHLLQLNITTFAFTYYSYYPNSVNKLKFDFCTTDYEPWHQHYLAEHYEEVDSTFTEINRTSLPTFWDVKRQLKEAKNKREKEMRLASLNFGIEKGLSIPIYGPQGDFAILVIIQLSGGNNLKHWKKIQYELLTVAYYYYSYLHKQLLKEQPNAKKHQLNKREQQCLILLAKHYSLDSIAKTLHITERTVNFHIQNLNKKLGTANKYQSVIKALHVGLIRL